MGDSNLSAFKTSRFAPGVLSVCISPGRNAYIRRKWIDASPWCEMIKRECSSCWWEGQRVVWRRSIIRYDAIELRIVRVLDKLVTLNSARLDSDQGKLGNDNTLPVTCDMTGHTVTRASEVISKIIQDIGANSVRDCRLSVI